MEPVLFRLVCFQHLEFCNIFLLWIWRVAGVGSTKQRSHRRQSNFGGEMKLLAHRKVIFRLYKILTQMSESVLYFKTPFS